MIPIQMIHENIIHSFIPTQHDGFYSWRSKNIFIFRFRNIANTYIIRLPKFYSIFVDEIFQSSDGFGTTYKLTSLYLSISKYYANLLQSIPTK